MDGVWGHTSICRHPSFPPLPVCACASPLQGSFSSLSVLGLKTISPPTESEVRASVAFQVSKLAALLSKALRMAAGQSAWDGLVTGC